MNQETKNSISKIICYIVRQTTSNIKHNLLVTSFSILISNKFHQFVVNPCTMGEEKPTSWADIGKHG